MVYGNPEIMKSTSKSTSRTTKIVDLEIGERPPPFAISLATSIVSRMDVEKAQPRRRKAWGVVGYCHLYSTFVIGAIGGGYGSVGVFYFVSIIFLFYMYFARVDPVPYVLRWAHKQLFESAFVVACWCWTYFMRDGNGWEAALGPSFCFNVVPYMNLWWNHDNFGILDCCLIILIDVALVFCRKRSVVVLTEVAFTGVAMQLMKNAYRRYASRKIENETEQRAV